LFSTILGKAFTPRFKAHGGSVSESLALQNLQARLRLCLSYFFVQLVLAVQGNPAPLLVIATGNCDEGLSGYFTKYDCSSGDLNPIGSICKNDLRRFVRFMMNKYEFMTETLQS
jgi:NAD+ synthase (glutamine-hydrolysing)